MVLTQRGRRLELHAILMGILGSDSVYFQPPETIKMEYPCIVYERSGLDTRFADDSPYARKMQYEVTVIDRDPDSVIPLMVSDLPFSRFDRVFTNDNLYHSVFNLYF